MKKTDVLFTLDNVYDSVYEMYEVSKELWEEAYQEGDLDGMRKATHKQTAYLEVMKMITKKWNEVV